MHTPGPWIVDRDAPNQVKQPVLSKRRRIVLPPDADGMSDARLVAEAPELLAIAKKLVKYRRSYPGVYFQTEKLDDFVHMLEVSIAKAEGPRAESGPIGAK